LETENYVKNVEKQIIEENILNTINAQALYEKSQTIDAK